MSSKRSKKKKHQEADTGGSPAQKSGGLLIYVPAFCSLIGTLMLLIVIALAVPLTVPGYLGYQVYNVVSGSMEPSIPIGSVIYVKTVDPVDITKGDVIAFQSGDSVIMHRVVDNKIVEGTFVTKGDANEAEAVYQQAAKIYPNDARAYNNIATLEYAKGNYEAAKEYIQKAQRVNASLPEAAANLGMLALKAGDVKTAEQYIASATGANGLAEVLGNLNLAKGNYAQAEQDFADTYSNSAALAQILNKNYASADITLRYVKNPDATTDYLKAILYSRMGNTADAAEALRSAISKDSSFAKYAANDIELANIQK